MPTSSPAITTATGRLRNGEAPLAGGGFNEGASDMGRGMAGQLVTVIHPLTKSLSLIAPAPVLRTQAPTK
jgi:hypothetical protein